MSCKFILRFDDICPTINREIWEQIVGILYKYNVKPIIAVIPNNKDSKFVENSGNDDFWQEIKKFQEDGWMIGLHGYDHRYLSHKSGILGISANTEFAGVAYDKQMEKIRAGILVFNNHKIKVDAFVAPSHSFDSNTIKILKDCGVGIISDGLIIEPFEWRGIKWIPCQLWDEIVPKKKGIYTVCIHITGWDNDRIKKFENNLVCYLNNIISPYDIENYNKLKFSGVCNIYIISWQQKIKRIIKKLLYKAKFT